MAYYVTLKEGKEYKTIDITKANIFNKLSNYKQEGACSLQEIDMLTTQFNDEEELRNYLFEQNIISSSDMTKQMSIRLKNNGQYKKVMYNILYQNEMLLLFPDILIKEILNRSNDYDFLEKFVKRFYDYYDCRISINELGCYVNDSIRSGIRSKHLDERLEDVLKYLIYDKDKKVKYANLHTIAAFVSNYDKKAVETKVTKPKTKTKKKEVPGQISLFD